MRQKPCHVNRPSESFYNVLYTLPLFARRHRLLERGIHTFPCLYQHFKTCFKMHATKTVSCKSALRKLLQRAIHTSPVCSLAQAFRTRDTHFPLFVCRRRLRGIHTFAFRHRLLERGVHTFRTSSVSSSAQLAFRTGHKPLFVR